MDDILLAYRKLTESRFYTNRNLRLDDLIRMLTDIYGDPTLLEIDDKKLLLFTDIFDNVGETRIAVDPAVSNLTEWYEVIETITKHKIEDEINNLDIEKHVSFIQNTLQKLSYILIQIELLKVDDSMSLSHSNIIEKVNNFIKLIKRVYLKISDIKPVKRTFNKIKWLGNKNVLGTLFYELWKGQTNDEGKTTKQMIEVPEKQDLINFIIENFIDDEGNEFKYSSLSGQLSESNNKSDERATNKKIIFKIP